MPVGEMHVDSNPCEQIPQCFLLKEVGNNVSSCENLTFIQDKQHLESVLGQGHETWFEELTVRQIQRRKDRVNSVWSAVDSPTRSPTVSQLIQNQLTVGSSPVGLRHSSPFPYCEHEESFNARLSLGTPQSGSWEKPELGLSPGPSPIIQDNFSLYHPGSSGVYSMGLDDSTLLWSNSLATPPRDPSLTDSLDCDRKLSTSKTKDTARALFSPGNKLDTTGESIRPLDSTFEEDQSDMDESQSNLQQANQNVIQAENATSADPNKMPTSNNRKTQDIQTKADSVKEKLTETKHMENWKVNFKNRLIFRKESSTESSKKFKSKNRNRLTVYVNDEANNHRQSADKDNTPSYYGSAEQLTSVPNDIEESSLSPTFSQKNILNWSKSKSRKSPTMSSRYKCSSVDDVLSDFFDPPSASVGKRKPAPSRKRKSLELQENAVFHCSTVVSYEESDFHYNVSTPNGTLQSILSSSKKQIGSSCKKVRFSDNVQKYSFIPEQETNMKRCDGTDTSSKRRCLTKKVQFEEVVLSFKTELHNESPSDKKSNGVEERVHLVYETKDQDTKKDSDVLTKVKSTKCMGVKCERNENGCRKAPSKIPTLTATESNVLNKKNMKKQLSKANSRKTEKCRGIQPYTRSSRKIEGDGPETPVRKLSEDRQGDELFSQVSPSALDEMCDVAEQSVPNDVCTARTATVQSNDNSLVKPAKTLVTKKFCYPSDSQISTACSAKVFQYNERVKKDENKKVLLKSIHLEEIVNKYSEKSGKKEETGNVEELAEGTNLNIHQTYNTEQKLINYVICETENKLMPGENHSERKKMLSVKKKNLDQLTTSLISNPGKQPISSRAEFQSAAGTSNQSTSSHAEFQSAAGRQVHIPIRALEQATNFLQEDTVENLHEEHRSASIGSLHYPVKISSVLGSKSTDYLSENSISLRNDMPGGFKTSSGKNVLLPVQALFKAKNLLAEENIEENLVLASIQKQLNMTGNVLGKTNEKPQNNVTNSCEGFQSASENALHIPTQALEIATSLLCGNKLKPQSFAGKQYSLHRNISKKESNMLQDEDTNSLLNSGSVPAKTLGKAVTLMHKNEIQSPVAFQNLDVHVQQTENRANDMFKGFQFASGKTLNIAAQALEKAAHLLEAEKIESVGQVNEEKRQKIISLCSNDTVQNIDDKSKTAAIKETRTCQHDLSVDDIEFSNWCDEEMESNEDLFLDTEELECNFSDTEISRNTQNAWPSESKGTRIRKTFSKDKENKSSTATVMKSDNVETEKAHGSNESVCKTSTCLHVDDMIVGFPTASAQKIKLDQISVAKAEVLTKDLMNVKDTDKLGTMGTHGNGDSTTNLDTHDNLKNCIQTKPQIMQETVSSPHATNRQILSNPNMKFGGFQMASGKRVAFNEEKLKEAETLLNDTENDKTPELKLSVELETIYKKKVLEMENKLSESQIKIIEENIETNTCGHNNRSGDMHEQFTDKLNVGFCMASGTRVLLSKGALDKASSFTDEQIDDDVPNKEGQSKYRQQENYENETGKISVAERLTLQFEYELKTDIAEEKRFDNELKEIKKFHSIKITDDQKSSSIASGKSANSRNSSVSKPFPTGANVPTGFRPFKPPIVSKSAGKEKYPESKSKEWGNEIDSNLKYLKSNIRSENMAVTLNEIEKQKSKRNETERSETKLINLYSHRSNVNTKENMQEMYNACGSMTSSKAILYPEYKLKHWGPEPERDRKHCEMKTVVDVSISDKKTANKHCTTCISHCSNCSENIEIQLQNDATCTYANNADIFQGISQMFDDDMEFTQIKLAEINILECSDLEALEDDGSSKMENKIVEKKNIENKYNSHSQSGNTVNTVDSREGGLTANYGRGVIVNEISENYSAANDQNMISAEKGNGENENYVGFSTASGKLLAISRTAIQSAEQMLFKCDEGNGIQGGGEKLQLDTNICGNKKDVSGGEKQEMLSFIHEKIGESEIETKKNDLCLSAIKLNMNSEMKKGVLGITSSNDRRNYSNEKQVRCTFQTASGKQVELSNSELKAVRKTLDENSDESTDSTAEERDLALKMQSVYCKYSNVTNVDLTHSKSDDISVTMQEEQQECPLTCLFKTANGKAVNVSETVLKEARKSMNEIENENIEETTMGVQFDRSNKISSRSSDLFQTKRGKSSNLLIPGKSVSALMQVALNERSKVDIKEDDSIDESEELRSMCSFQSASGMKVNVSHKVLKVASQTIDENEAKLHNVETNEQNKEVKLTNLLTTNSQFQTGSEKTTEISIKLSCGTEQKLNEAECVNNALYDHVVPECSILRRDSSISISSPLQTCITITSTDSEKEKSCVNSFGSEPGSIELPKVDEFMNTFRNERIDGASDDNLNHVRNKCDDIKGGNANTSTSSFPGISGFQTESGSKVHISKTALQHPRRTLGDNVDHDCCSVRDVSGFAAANERKVDISEKAVRHATETASDDQELNGKTENLSKLSKIDSVPMFCGFQTASGTKVQVSKTALLHAKRTLTENDESLNDRPIPCPVSCRYSTASGEKVHISETTMNHPKEKLADVTSIDKSEITAHYIGCSRLAGIKMFNLREKSYILSKEMGKEGSDKSYSISKFSGFSTASGTNVCFSDGALKHAEEKMVNSDVCPESISSVQMVGFRTASGTKVCVSERALEHAKETLIDVNESNELTDYVPKLAGLSTASSTNVHASEQALRDAKETLIHVGDSNENIAVVPTMGGFNAASVTKIEVSNRSTSSGFSTASGNKVQISETALQHAKETLAKTDEISDKVEFPATFLGIHTASRTKVEGSETDLKHAQVAQALTGEISDNTESFANHAKFLGFCTANETKIELSETDEISNKMECLAKFRGFSTASGSKVDISEAALRHAKGSLTETDEISSKMECPTKFLGFSTASGSKVKVSEAALKYAKGSLAETDKISNKMVCPPKFIGFSTASGSKVEVTEAALKHAKGSLAETDEISNKMVCPPKFIGFSTASGSKVEVSEAALKHAKGSLAETDEISKKMVCPPKFIGFSTASGSKVEVSEAALKHAKGSLAETDEISKKMVCPPKFIGFSTASGSKVEVSEAAFKHADWALAETENISDKSHSSSKLYGFNTAIGNKVNISEAALKHTKGPVHVIDMDRNERKHEPSAVSAKALNRATRDILDESHVNHLNRNQVEMGSMGTDQAEIYSVGIDLDETFGFALKRRKLDMNREQRVLRNVLDEDVACRRKPVKSTPEGITTDRRHPGFRPFKPVFCKSLATRKDRYDISTISTLLSMPTKQPSCASSFQTPYKNTPEKTYNGTNHISPRKTEFAVKAPVFMIKSGMCHGDVKELNNISKPSSVINVSACGDNRENAHAYNASVAETVKTSNTDLVDKRIESYTDANEMGATGSEKEEIDRTVGEMNKKNSSNQKLALEENKECKVTKETAPIETMHTTEIGELDAFSQEEDDVYYCMLVEARRHQDKLIAQRSSCRVCPVVGRLWEMKQMQGRWKLKELVDRLGQRPEKPVCVSSDISMRHVFCMETHYSRNTAHVLAGDGAYLVPDDAGKIGKREFYRAFLTLEGVDSKLISESWFYNHYRWIVWKLAAYENTSSYLHSRCLTPEMVMLQIKYRYDREVDLSQRSCIKKIFERDDTPSKRLVLCIATVRRICSNSSVADQSKPDIHEKILLELTDGWYSIPAQIDGPLAQLVLQAKIRVGQKLVMTGAELIGGEDACTPLEAPASVMLKICRNSTRLAPWDSILGYQNDPQPLCVPLSDLHGEGGAVGIVDVVFVRKYPILYMEKLVGGGCLFRTSRSEDEARQAFETRKQGEMEKVYREIENLVDREDKQVIKVCGHKKLSGPEMDDLQCGQDIYEAMEEAAQPDILQNYLSEHQLAMLYEYQRQVQEEKQLELNSKFQSAWQEKLETFQERVVTPMLKFRLAGCANRDLDHNTSTILTVWRPAPEILDLHEGHRYKIYGLNTSLSRSKYTGHRVQLTATKQTRFRRMKLDENTLDRIYEPREVLWVVDIKRRPPPYGELDFVGIVVQVAESIYNDRTCDTVYLADCQAGVLAIRFWNGRKGFGEDLFTVGSVLCCSNLIDKSNYRNPQIPTVEAAVEFTQLTNKSQNSAQRKALDKLNMVLKDKRSFMEKAMSDISIAKGNPNTPKKILEINEGVVEINEGVSAKSPVYRVECMPTEHIYRSKAEEMANTDRENIISDPYTEKSNDSLKDGNIPAEAETMATVVKIHIPPETDVCATIPAVERKRSVSQAKVARLMSYGSPSILSPLHTTVPRSVSKRFKPPAFKNL